jgi:hypothetical protein|tara:strand:- start:54 stop:590 length:537 start_codon:yes stop_codon:yes gene_type:complete
MGDLLVLVLIIVVLIGYIIYRRKKVAKLKAEGKKEKTYLGCTLPLIIFVLIVFIGMSFFIPFLHESYKNAEIKHGIKTAQERYLSNIKNYKNFSNKEAKELSMKLYLLDACEGGQKTIDRMRDFDGNAEIYSCMDLLRDGIRKEDLPKFETEIEKLKYINNLKFDPEALENYQSFINE